MRLVKINEPTPIGQFEVVALPSFRCLLFTDIPGNFIASNTANFFDIINLVFDANSQTEVKGGFITDITSNSVILLKRK